MKLSFCFLLCTFSLFSQNIRYEDATYQNNIKTIMLTTLNNEMGIPILDINQPDQQLQLSFDDLDSDIKNYSIYFIHCDAYWKPSDLMTSEYINGFFELNILNYNFSQNLLQKYTHYNINFPTSNLQFTKAGNYLLVLYKDSDKSKVVATKRFYILNNVVNVGGQMSQPIGGDRQYTGQHIDFFINGKSYEITNPSTDMKVFIMQNFRTDNAVTDVQPTFINGNTFSYSLDDKTTFSGSNEFRYFDTRTLLTYTERIANVLKDDNSKWQVYLTTDVPRFNQRYSTYNDINGNYIIRNNDKMANPDIEADYTWVNFFFACTEPIANGNIYILGKLTNWQLNNDNKMTYNYQKKGYECKLYLKQGYYNYMYTILYDNQNQGDESFTEGNFWQTENDYYIFVYHKPRGYYYDQLIGLIRLNNLGR